MARFQAVMGLFHIPVLVGLSCLVRLERIPKCLNNP